MSKCAYNELYLPILIGGYSNFEGFKNHFETYFEEQSTDDYRKIIEENKDYIIIESDQIKGSEQQVEEVKDVTKADVESQILSERTLEEEPVSVTSDVWLKMKNDFGYTLVNDYMLKHDANENSVNEFLFNYKLRLLSDVLTRIPDNSIDTALYSSKQDIIDNFDLLLDEVSKLEMPTDVNYNILINFDSLLSQLSDFITPKKVIINTANMYELKESSVEHRTGFSSGKEIPMADIVSNLHKLILNYMKVDGMENMYVGYEFLNYTINTIRRVVNNEEVSDNTVEGKLVFDRIKENNFTLNDINYMINGFLRPKNPWNITQFNSPIIKRKLKALQDNIFNNDKGLPIDIKNSYLGLIQKVDNVHYVQYVYDYKVGNEGLSVSEINEQFLVDSSWSVYNQINASVLNSSLNEGKVLINNVLFNNTIGNSVTIPYKSGSIIVNVTYSAGNANNSGVYDIKLNNVSNDQFREFIQDLTGFQVDINYPQNLLVTHFTSMIATTVFASLDKLNKESEHGFSYVNNSNKELLYLNELYGLTKDGLLHNLSLLKRDYEKAIMTFKDGSKMPVNQLRCLASDTQQMIAKLQKDAYNDDYNVYAKSFLYKDYNKKVGANVVRTGLQLADKTVKVSDLSARQLVELELYTDILYNVFDNTSNSIFLQDTNYADKRTQFMLNIRSDYEFGKGNTLKKLLKDYITGTNDKAYDILSKLIEDNYNHQNKVRYQNILNDYKIIFKELNLSEPKSLEDVNVQLKTLTTNQIYSIGSKKGLRIIKDIHFTSQKGVKGIFINPEILNPTEFKARYDKDINQLVSFYQSYEVGKYQGFNQAKYKDQLKDWTNEDGSMIYKKDGKVNPLIVTQMLLHNLYANSNSELLSGSYLAHPTKSKNSDQSSSNYKLNDEASRLISFYKRNSTNGARRHHFMQNVYKGVSKTINVATVNDISAYTYNMIGVTDKIDSSDGSGLSSMIQSILENNSLMYDKVGYDKKTIMSDNDARYGAATLCKWAVFAITNERRRNSFKSKASLELMHKKMHSKSLDLTEKDVKKLNDIVKNYFHTAYKDPYSNNIYKINYIQFQWDTTTQSMKAGVSKNDVLVNGIGAETRSIHDIDSLYDLEQLLGGAFNGEIKTIEDINGYTKNEFSYSDMSNSMFLVDVVSELKKHDKFTAYIVNNSANKTGASNINESNVFYDDTELNTYKMSTKFGGVLLNSDHDLEHSEISETTQMISALIQGGVSTDIVLDIYNDLGNIAYNAIKNIANVSFEGNKTKLFEILTKQLINVFSDGKQDTLGLAQAFFKKAQEELEANNIQFNIPFSSNDVYGKFVSNVSSTMNKQAIKRKYEGVAAVLIPSYDHIQLFEVDGVTMNYDNFIKYVNDNYVVYDENGNKLDGASWVFDNTHIYNENGEMIQSPFIEPVYNISQVKQNMTLSLGRINDNDELELTEYVVDSFQKYDDLKTILNDYDYVTILKHKPRNLNSLDIRFNVTTVINDGYFENDQWVEAEQKVTEQIGLYDLDEVRASHYIQDVKNADSWSRLSESKKEVLNSVLGVGFDVTKQAENIKIINNKVKKLLQDLDNDEATVNYLGQSLTATNIQVSKFEVIMGKAFAKQFDLKEGDNINNIDVDFFKKRISSKYLNGLSVKDACLDYDGVIYDGRGNKIFITNKKPSDTTVKGSVQLAKDGIYYFNEKTPLFEAEDGIIFYKDEFGDDVVYINHLNKIEELFNKTEFNMTLFNYDNSEENKQLLQWQQDKYNNFINITAINKYKSFKKSLDIIGVRIPSQAMQSFMSMEIKAFTDSGLNEVYVPKSQTWLQGSDYDIDKLYVLMHSISKDGLVDTGSNLQYHFDIDLVSQLPEPNGIWRNAVTKNSDGEFIDKNGVVIDPSDVAVFNDDNFDTSIDFWNVELFIIESNGKSFYYSEDKKMNRAVKRCAYYANIHNTSERSNNQQSDKFKNRIIDNIHKVMTNPKNQINAHNPISMGSVGEAASKSKLGALEQTLSVYNPFAKFIQQEQNALGSTSIGIEAVGIKAFTGLCTYYNKLITDCEKEIELFIKNGDLGLIRPAVEKLAKDLNVIKTKGSPRYISGLNFYNLNKLLVKANSLDAINIIIEINNSSNRADAMSNLSSLLSAATDNAKELILSKINATPILLPMYNYLISIGYEFEDITSLLMSDACNDIVALSKNDPLIEKFGYNIKDIISFIKGEGMLNNSHYGLFYSFFQQFNISNELLNKLGVKDLSINSKEGLLILMKNIDKLTINGKDLTYENGISVRSRIANDLYNSSKKRHGSNDSMMEEEFMAAQLMEELMSESSAENQFEQYDEYGIQYDEADSIIELIPLTTQTYKKLLLLYDKRVSTAIIPAESEDQSIQKYINDLKAIDAHLTGADTFSLVGRVFGINQGLKTNLYDQFSLIKAINNHCSTKEYTFDLIKWLKLDDLNKENDMKRLDSKPFNILRLINTIPHYKAMYNVLLKNHQALSGSSIKYRSLYKYLNENKKVTQSSFSSASNYIDDTILFNFFKNITFTPSKIYKIKNGIVSIHNNESKEKITIKNVSDILSLKQYIDDLIGSLKTGEYKDNPFIKDLSFGIKQRGKEYLTFYKPSINMMNIDNVTDIASAYTELQKGFDELSNVMYNGISVTDLLYLYNIIINKNKFTTTSLSRFFEKQVSNTTSIVYKLNDYIGLSDKSDETLTINSEELVPANNKLDFITLGVNGLHFNGITKYNEKMAYENMISSTVNKLKDAGKIIMVSEQRNVKGYVKDGVIHINNINTNKGLRSTLVHELSHLWLFSFKYDKVDDKYSVSKKYINMYNKIVESLNKVNKESDFDKFVLSRYNEVTKSDKVVGSDIIDEIIVKYIELNINTPNELNVNNLDTDELISNLFSNYNKELNIFEELFDNDRLSFTSDETSSILGSKMVKIREFLSNKGIITKTEC